MLADYNSHVKPTAVPRKRDGSFYFRYNTWHIRGFVFIDGSNFYFKLKRLTGDAGGSAALSTFDFKAFAEWLVQPQELSGVRYYIGAVKQQGSGICCVERSAGSG